MRTFRRCLALVEPGRRARWFGLLVLAVLVSAVEALGGLLVFLVLRLVADPGAAELGVPVLGDLDGILPEGDTATVVTRMALVIAAFFLLRAVVVVGQSYAQGRVAERAGVRIASRLLHGYLLMPYAFHLRRNSAELMRNVHDAVREVVANTLIPTLRLLSEALVVLALAIVLIVTAPAALGLAVAVLGPVIYVLLRVVQPRIAVLGQRSHDLGEATLRTLQQSLQGFRDVKLLGRQGFFHDRFVAEREGIASAHYVRQGLAEVPRVTLETSLVLFVLFVLVAALQRGGSPQESLAVLGLFGYAALRVLPALNRVVLMMNDIKYGAAPTKQVYDDLMLVEHPDVLLARSDADEGRRLPLEDRVTVESVRFRYDGAAADALVDIEIEIHQGESIGLVGPSGGGKSTLVDLVLGLLEPTEGRVCVDGIDIRDRLADWQRNLGVVPQSIYLLDDTLRRNVALGLDDDEIDEDAVREAVRLAQLEPFVASLPDGLDTHAGDQGVRVSGGQRQRVAIARALYRRPDVLVFDEGTSALDNLTEEELIEELDRLRGERTMLIVAHRLTTVRRCDRIVFIREGRIDDVGSYDELLGRNADFRRLAG